MKPSKTLVAACDLLKRRVRFERAGLRLPSTPFPGDDTEEIREACRLYTETWVVPIIEAIEQGKTGRLRRIVELER